MRRDAPPWTRTCTTSSRPWASGWPSGRSGMQWSGRSGNWRPPGAGTHSGVAGGWIQTPGERTPIRTTHHPLTATHHPLRGVWDGYFCYGVRWIFFLGCRRMVLMLDPIAGEPSSNLPIRPIADDNTGWMDTLYQKRKWQRLHTLKYISISIFFNLSHNLIYYARTFVQPCMPNVFWHRFF